MKMYLEGTESAVSKTGNPYLKVTGTCSDKVRRMFYLWDHLDLFNQLVENGTKVFEFESDNDPSFPKIVVFDASTGDLNEFYSFILPNDQTSYKLLEQLISYISDPLYLAIVQGVFNLSYPDNPNGFKLIRDCFCVLPGAKRYHHDYRYGLIQHTSEVMAFCARVAKAEQFKGVLDEQTVLTAALLHDVGKCFEYSTNGISADYGATPEVNQMFLGSHLYKGAELVEVVYHDLVSAGKFTSRADRLKVEHIKHCIGAHHLMREWNSICDHPQSLEALLVFLGDYFSAAYGKFNSIDWKSIDSIEHLIAQTSKSDSFFGFARGLELLQEDMLS